MTHNFKSGDKLVINYAASINVADEDYTGSTGALNTLKAATAPLTYAHAHDQRHGNIIVTDANGVRIEADARRLMLAPAVFSLEIGKFYKDRDGNRIGPMTKPEPHRWDPRYTHQAETAEGGQSVWTPSGKYYTSPDDDRRDLIALWVDEPAIPAIPQAPAVTFKAGDKVRRKSGEKWGDYHVVTLSRPTGTVGWFAKETGTWLETYKFELVPVATPLAADEFIVVAVKSTGKLDCAAAPFVHATRKEAETEALRLSANVPGTEFQVRGFCKLSSAIAPKPVKPSLTSFSA